jgi:predicted secreted protein
MEWMKSLGRRLTGRAPGPRVEDARGRRLVAVIECVLNQNARDAGTARSPAVIGEVVRLCEEHGVGLLQMPCPEIACLGLSRARPRGKSIHAALDTPEGWERCGRMAEEVAGRIEEYTQHGCRVLAVLGGNAASPGCAVHVDAGGLLPTSGVFLLQLQGSLRRRGLEIPFRGLRDNDPALLAEDLAWLRGLFSAGSK